jgi:hypothetical protein
MKGKFILLSIETYKEREIPCTLSGKQRVLITENAVTVASPSTYDPE